ncbi:MAG: VWA domain-containing protein [Oceanipulchritudo sp.]
MMPLFAEPLWLPGGVLAVLFLLVLFLLAERSSRRRLERFAGSELAGRLTGSHSRRRLWIKHSLAGLAVLLLAGSLARPQWGADWEKAETSGIDIMIALDTSRSMLAEDISPNRLERSRLAILDLLESVQGDRVGLIAFAGNAFLQCPLTLDYQAFRQTLAAIDTDTIPVGGTDLASAIDEAEAYFEKSGNERLLILITDGEDLEDSGIRRAREAGEAGTRILTVGVGSTSGELIPVRSPDGQTDFLRDASGKPVSTSLDASTLRELAEVSNGLYAPLGNGSGLQRVYEFSLAQSEDSERREMLQRIPIERYQWPLALALVLIVIETLLTTRRRFKGASSATASYFLAALLLGTLSPQSLRADSAMEAMEAYEEGRYEESVSLYREALEEDPDAPRLRYNLGVSAYRAEQFETALAQFETVIRSGEVPLQEKAFYNAGNSRVALGFEALREEPSQARDLWEAALADYENALGLDPGHERASRNRTTLQETIAAHTYRLQTAAEPEAGGTVSPGGEAFHRVPVPLEAEPAGGWVFDAWSGEDIDNPEEAETVIRLERDRSVVARFVKTWELTVRSADPEMGSAGKSGTYREDEPVPVTAEAEDDYAFSKWIADGCEVADPESAETEVTLSADATLTATFVPAFELSVHLEPEIAGKAGPSGFFEEYSIVPITAQPRPGFEWENWTGDGIQDPEAMETTIALTADRVAIASMKRVWNLVIIPTPEEGGTVEGAGNHPVGSTVPISASPSDGFRFEGWEGPGVEDPASPESRVTVTSEEHTLFARFAQEDQEDQQDQEQDQQDQQDQEQDQQDQEQDQQENGDPGDQDEPQDPQDDEREPEEDPGEQEDTASDESEPEEAESPPQEEADPPEAGEERAETEAVPGEMSREEARQLLRALSENERFLPAGERSREPQEGPRRPTGKDW